MLPASLHLLPVVRHVWDHISSQLVWSKCFHVLVFFQVHPCSACPSAAVAPPDHTLAPLPIPKRTRPNMSLLAGHLATAVQGRVPVITSLLLPKRQRWLLLLPTRGIITLPVESYKTSTATAPACSSSHTVQLTKTILRQHELNWNPCNSSCNEIRADQVWFPL